MNYVQLNKLEIVHSFVTFMLSTTLFLLNTNVLEDYVTVRAIGYIFNIPVFSYIFLSSSAPPTNVSISQLPARPLEGEKVTLSCLGHSHLPISSYRWYRVFGEQSVLLREDSGSLSLSVTRDVGRFRCSALNEMGECSSDTMAVNVECMYHYAINVFVTIL